MCRGLFSAAHSETPNTHRQQDERHHSPDAGQCFLGFRHSPASLLVSEMNLWLGRKGHEGGGGVKGGVSERTKGQRQTETG